MCSTLADSMYVFVYIRAVMALSISSVIGRACTINFFSKQRYHTDLTISRTSCKLPHLFLPIMNHFGRFVFVHACYFRGVPQIRGSVSTALRHRLCKKGIWCRRERFSTMEKMPQTIMITYLLYLYKRYKINCPAFSSFLYL